MGTLNPLLACSLGCPLLTRTPLGPNHQQDILTRLDVAVMCPSPGYFNVTYLGGGVATMMVQPGYGSSASLAVRHFVFL